MVQRLGAFTAEGPAWVQSLVGALRFHKPRGVEKKKKSSAVLSSRVHWRTKEAKEAISCPYRSLHLVTNNNNSNNDNDRLKTKMLPLLALLPLLNFYLLRFLRAARWILLSSLPA